MKHFNLLFSNKNDSLASYPVSPLAKQIRQVFPSSNSRISTSFDLVHMDLWGPYKIPTLDKKHYFLTIVDDYSRFVWIYLLKLKSETIVAIKLFFSMIKTQFGAYAKVVRSDNGTEFFNSQCMKLFH